jgi:hypothetical protein
MQALYKAVNEAVGVMATIHEADNTFKVRFHDTDTDAIIAIKSFTHYDDAEACADCFVFED